MLRFFALAALALSACSTSPPVVAGVGDRLQSFMVSTSSTTPPTCYVCEYGGKPVIMAIGDPDDDAFLDDLSKLQALAKQHEGLRVFAIASELAEGKHTPFADEAATLTRLVELRRARGIEFPVALVPKDSEAFIQKGFHRFEATYRLKGPRTLLFAGADGKVRWAEDVRDEEQHASLAKAVAAAL